jgi:hypothetical protein
MIDIIRSSEMLTRTKVKIFCTSYKIKLVTPPEKWKNYSNKDYSTRFFRTITVIVTKKLKIKTLAQ